MSTAIKSVKFFPFITINLIIAYLTSFFDILTLPVPCMSPVSWCAGVSTPIGLISRAHSELVSGMLWAINDIRLSCDSLMVTLISFPDTIMISATYVSGLCPLWLSETVDLSFQPSSTGYTNIGLPCLIWCAECLPLCLSLGHKSVCTTTFVVAIISGQFCSQISLHSANSSQVSWDVSCPFVCCAVILFFCLEYVVQCPNEFCSQ